MPKLFSENKRSHVPFHVFSFRTAMILFILTMISLWLVCTLLARFSSYGRETDGARVAAAGNVSVYEYGADLVDGEYVITDRTEANYKQKNRYTVVPGMNIEKEAFVSVSGSREVSAYVYIEVVSSDPSKNILDYTVDNIYWKPTTDVSATHSGTVYKYKDVIPPNTEQTIGHIIRNNKVRIKDDILDKTDPTNVPATVSLDIYAYLVQAD